MCFRVNCLTCGLITYRGCGNHIEQVYYKIDKSKICQCAKPNPEPAKPNQKPVLTFVEPSADSNNNEDA